MWSPSQPSHILSSFCCLFLFSANPEWVTGVIYGKVKIQLFSETFSTIYLSLFQIYPSPTHCLWKEIGRNNWRAIQNFASIFAIFPKAIEMNVEISIYSWILHFCIQHRIFFFESHNSLSFLFSLINRLPVLLSLLSLSALTWLLYHWLHICRSNVVIQFPVQVNL